MKHAAEKIVAICSILLSKLGRSCGAELSKASFKFTWVRSADMLKAQQQGTDRD